MGEDKQIVVFHDDDLSRMTACAYKDRINDISYADLPELVPGILQRNRIADVVDGNRLKPYLTEEVKSRIKASKKSTDYLWSRIPLFEEVLAVLPEHIGIIIEVKDHQPEMIPLLHALIRKQTQARQNNLFWFSLQPGLNSNLRSFDASVPCITSLPNILRVLMCYALGIAPFIDLQCDVFGIDCRIIDQERVDNEKSIKSLPQWAKNLIAYLFQGSPPQLLLLPYLYAMLRKKGVPVFFLGVDSIQFLHTAMRNGASAVLTDKPNMICAYMNAQRLGMNEVSY